MWESMVAILCLPAHKQCGCSLPPSCFEHDPATLQTRVFPFEPASLGVSSLWGIHSWRAAPSVSAHEVTAAVIRRASSCWRAVKGRAVIHTGAGTNRGSQPTTPHRPTLVLSPPAAIVG